MKHRLVMLGLSFYCFAVSPGCKDKKGDAPQRLSIAGVADSAIVLPGTILQFSATPAANWSMVNISADATVDNSGKFIAGMADAAYRLIAVNTLNSRDTLRRLVIVTKHASLFNNMKNGGYILSFRHADASLGADQTTSTVAGWWKNCDPLLARQITDPLGYRQSDSTGYTFKLLRLPFDSSLSSEFCRCRQTVQHFNLAVPNKEYAALTYLVYDENNRYANTMNLYASLPIRPRNYLSVTHAGFANLPNPAPLANLQWGDCAVFKLAGPGLQPAYVATITIGDWLKLAR